MVALATVEDLATFVQRDLSAEDTATASLLLDIVSAAIRNFTGQTITAVTGDVVTLDALGKSVLFLPEVPVTAVASVIADGVTVPSTDYHWYRDGRLYRKNYWWWGIDRQSVVVTYGHGYAAGAPELDPARGVCLEVAGSMLAFDEAGRIKSESVGTYSVTYQDAARRVEEIGASQLSGYRLLVVA